MSIETTAPPTEAVDEPAVDLSHTWMVAANIPVTERLAAFAAMRKYYLIPEKTRVSALDVYCGECRRTINDLEDQPECSAKTNNEHLIGGDQAHRKKRKIAEPPPGAVVRPGPTINRRGVENYLTPRR